ncbi:hypothetical protein LA080_001172 [Diaporthe eres]|nr:hypothetical protein LA080_001172 [Diaporthe eres]
MCSTITVYGACNHTHMEKTSFEDLPSVTRLRSDGYCRICRQNRDRERRESEATRRNTARGTSNRDSYVDPVLNQQFAALPHFTLQAPPAAKVRQPRTQPQQRPRMSSVRSNQDVQRSNAVSTRPQRGPSLRHPVPISHPTARFLDAGYPLPSPPPPGRPRVNPNIPRSVTTMHVRDGSVSPVEPGFSDARSVSPDEYGRAPWQHRR